MKPQDILLLLKLVSIQTPERDDWTDPTLIALHSVRALSQATGISKSEVALSLQRSLANGLARRDVRTDIPLAVRPALIEFLTHGLRYVYPAAPGSLTRGMITGGAAVPGPARLTTGDALAPVWPDPAGRGGGPAVTPLFWSAPEAARADARLYALLAAVDGVRLGEPDAANRLVAVMAG